MNRAAERGALYAAVPWANWGLAAFSTTKACVRLVPTGPNDANRRLDRAVKLTKNARLVEGVAPKKHGSLLRETPWAKRVRARLSKRMR